VVTESWKVGRQERHVTLATRRLDVKSSGHGQ
jgi:hypothetical protein